MSDEYDNKRKKKDDDEENNLFKQTILYPDLTLLTNNEEKEDSIDNYQDIIELQTNYIEVVLEVYNDILKFINEISLPIAEYLSFDEILDFTNKL